MKLEERIELEGLARLHELLETKYDPQIRHQSSRHRLVGRDGRLARYIVCDVVGERERNCLFDEICQRHFRKEREGVQDNTEGRDRVGWRDEGGRG